MISICRMVRDKCQPCKWVQSLNNRRLQTVCFSVTNRLSSLYLKHVLGPHFKWLFLAAQLVPFSHLQHRLPAKFPDDFVKWARERTEVWVSSRAQAEHRIPWKFKIKNGKRPKYLQVAWSHKRINLLDFAMVFPSKQTKRQTTCVYFTLRKSLLSSCITLSAQSYWRL